MKIFISETNLYSAQAVCPVMDRLHAACFDLFASQRGRRTGARKPVLFLAASKEKTMSCLHRRLASTTLSERFHRTTVVLTGVLLPLARHARRKLRDRIAAVRQTSHQIASHLRRR
ncbi:hypothetical protein ACLKMY_16755 [Paraburkholderia mimosarum]|uniref:hypothetical protein n=1 Tax=Paraburkholderia mimosarum TaxID=312026 RepID=UPI0039C16A35